MPNATAVMMWFFRILELEDGRWACRRGRFTTDEHDTFAESLIHTKTLAAAEPPSRVFVHPLDSPPWIAAVFDNTD